MTPKISLRPVKSTDTDYDLIQDLLLSAFPECERHDLPEQSHNVDADDVPMTCFAAYETATNRLIGFATIWDMGAYRYIEHLATADIARNCGYGGMILDQIIDMSASPIVLEVEPEEMDPMARRRIGFYERHGLHLWRDRDYLQPPYRAGGESVRLMLMATEGLTPEAHFDGIVRDLVSVVYPPQSDSVR